jgi:hypothetical protein
MSMMSRRTWESIFCLRIRPFNKTCLRLLQPRASSLVVTLRPLAPSLQYQSGPQPPVSGPRPQVPSLVSPTSGLQPPIPSLRSPASDPQPQISSLRPSASSLQLQASSLRPPASGLQPPASNPRPPTRSLQPEASSPKLSIPGLRMNIHEY